MESEWDSGSGWGQDRPADSLGIGQRDAGGVLTTAGLGKLTRLLGGEN